MAVTNFGFMDYLEDAKHILNNPWITIFLVVLIVDLITGTLKPFSHHSVKKVDSTTGLSGLVKHSTILLLTLLLYPLLDILNKQGIGNLFIAFYILHYLVSIVENLGEMGIPLPAGVSDKLEKMRDDVDKNSIDELKKDDKDGK